MSKTLLRLLAIFLAFGLIAAACGDDDDDEAGSEESTEEAGDAESDEGGDDEMTDGFDLDGQTVTVAVENAYLPFNYLDPETGEPTGWDYEVIDEICTIINCVPDYKTFSWEPMIQAVADGQFDMAADGITITEERAQIVDFSEGYIAIEQRLLVPLDSEFTSVDDLVASDCSVASQVGTTNLQTAIDTFGEDRVTALEEFGFVVQSVIAGDNCAAVIDETAGVGYVGANADDVQLIGDSLSSDQLGFIFTPGSELVAPFNHALGEMKANGSLEEISTKYFGDAFTISYDDIEFPDCGPDEGCAEEEGGDEESSAGGAGDGELKIGWVLPQTGGLSAVIDALVKPIEMAEQEILDAGGQITIVSADSGQDANIASASVDQLLNDDVDAIIGPAATGVTLAVIDKVTGSEVVQCSGSTTGAVFTDYPDGGYYFRTTPPDSLQGQVLADLITDDGATSVGVIYRNDEYGAGLDRALSDALEANGVSVPVRVAIDENATSYDAEVGQVQSEGVDAIVVITFAEGATLIQGMIEAGIGPQDVQMYVTDGISQNVAPTDVDPDNPAIFEGVRGTAPSIAPPDGEPTFIERFEAFAPPDTPTIFSAHHYDCVNIIALASLAAGTDDPTVFVNEMIEVTNGEVPCISYAECAPLIEAGDDIDYQGASGPVDFSDAGEPTAGVYDVYEYDAEGNIQYFDAVPIAS